MSNSSSSINSFRAKNETNGSKKLKVTLTALHTLDSALAGVRDESSERV